MFFILEHLLICFHFRLFDILLYKFIPQLYDKSFHVIYFVFPNLEFLQLNKTRVGKQPITVCEFH